MNFELTTENLIECSSHDIDFVRQPFNALDALRTILTEHGQRELDVVSVINRITGESVSFDKAKASLDKLYYRNQCPEYEETSSGSFKYEGYPIINPDLIFKLIFGNFIDFQIFNQNTYDGGYLYWDFRFNEIVPSLIPNSQSERLTIPESMAKPRLSSFQEERGGGYMFEQTTGKKNNG